MQLAVRWTNPHGSLPVAWHPTQSATTGTENYVSGCQAMGMWELGSMGHVKFGGKWNILCLYSVGHLMTARSCLYPRDPLFSLPSTMTRCTLPPWLSLIFIALIWIHKKELDFVSHSDYATLPFASFFLKFLFLVCNGEEPWSSRTLNRKCCVPHRWVPSPRTLAEPGLPWESSLAPLAALCFFSFYSNFSSLRKDALGQDKCVVYSSPEAPGSFQASCEG